MPPFKEDQIMLLSPGSHTTLAQLGLPESFTPAQVRVKSRMFAGEKDGEWEPYKVRAKSPKPVTTEVEVDPDASQNPTAETNLYEDWETDDGAVWPMTEGRITDWSCFFALMNHVYNKLSPHMHIQTPILCIAQPCWSERDHEQITQFFFEKFRCPAFSLVDAATAALYGFNVENACVIDVGFSKADITAITGFEVNRIGRTVALANCGGDTMTQTLLNTLATKQFTRDMCEQLKRNPICEILPPGTPMPGNEGANSGNSRDGVMASSSSLIDPGADNRPSVNLGGGLNSNAMIGDDLDGAGDQEGVLDVASIVTGGEKKMEEFLARKEREKAEKASRKKGAASADSRNKEGSKDAKLPNSRRGKAVFTYESHLHSKAANGSGDNIGQAGSSSNQVNGTSGQIVDEPKESFQGPAAMSQREVEVGVERFGAVSDGLLDRLTDAIYRTINAVDVAKRSDVWDSLIVVGNGAKIRGFKEALMMTLQKKYIISPSSATMFTSEIPSTISTPAGTGSQTPQPQIGGAPQSSGVNPLLLAATTASNPHLQPGGLTQGQHHNIHSSHGQTPTSAKWAKPMEYFPEWKEFGFEEAQFLGAQVAAKIFFINPPGDCKTYLSRTDYNEMGPGGVHQIYV